MPGKNKNAGRKKIKQTVAYLRKIIMIDVIILYGAVDGGRNNWPRRIVIVRRENAFTDPMTFALGGGGRLAHFHFFFFFSLVVRLLARHVRLRPVRFLLFVVVPRAAAAFPNKRVSSRRVRISQFFTPLCTASQYGNRKKI